MSDGISKLQNLYDRHMDGSNNTVDFDAYVQAVDAMLPTLLEAAEQLDLLAASYENILLHLGGKMTHHDEIARGQLLARVQHTLEELRNWSMLNLWLHRTRRVIRSGLGDYLGLHIRPLLKCKDGTTMSVQASSCHYCTPRSDEGPYSSVEVWCVEGRQVPDVWKLDREGDEPFGFMPIAAVEKFILECGGIDDQTGEVEQKDA